MPSSGKLGVAENDEERSIANCSAVGLGIRVGHGWQKRDCQLSKLLTTPCRIDDYQLRQRRVADRRFDWAVANKR
jgi:hypothetical protein